MSLKTVSMRRIVVAADSFKGSLTSLEVAEAFVCGFRRVFPLCEVERVAVADGGEGTVEALVGMLEGEYVELQVADPLLRRVQARYGIVNGGCTAVMEMSAASGLPLLTAQERNPLKTTTYGAGEMIADALGRGCREFLIGIGGSATNDAGVGMLRALGFRFLDAEGAELVGGGEILECIKSIDDSGVLPSLRDAEFRVACDVTSPLYGPEGAAYVFALQKGADEAMVERLDAGLRNFAEVVKRYNGEDIATLRGAGAAGGVGGGLKALLGARLEQGVDMVLEAIRFDDIIKECDLVVTGEGRLDSQTMMGKAPCGVLQAAKRQGVPCVAIGGAIEKCEELEQSGFAAMFSVTPEDMPLQQAMQRAVAMANVERAAEQIARLLSCK